MFEPTPSYRILNGYEATAKRELKQFQQRIINHSQANGIPYENRFVFILHICDRLQALLDAEGDNLFPDSAKEPIESFQVLFQLLVYALGDCGLLYNPYGAWNIEPDQEFWEESERSYWRLVAAMRDRNLAYLSLKNIRKGIKAHEQQQYLYNESSEQEKRAEVYAAKAMEERHKALEDAHRKYFADVDFEKFHSSLAQMERDYFCMQCSPLFLFFALYGTETKTYGGEYFYADLKQNRRRFPPPQKQMPKHIENTCLDWEHYLQCEKFCRRFENHFSAARPLPDPYFLVGLLCDDANVRISIQQTVAIANYALEYLVSGRVSQPPAVRDITINTTPLIDIVEALITIFRTSEFQFEGACEIAPRMLKQSLRIVLDSGIIDNENFREIDRQPFDVDLTEEDLDTIKAAVLDKYGAISYEFSREIFWMVTGYIPPSEFVPEKGATDLYSVCFRHLHRIW